MPGNTELPLASGYLAQQSQAKQAFAKLPIAGLDEAGRGPLAGPVVAAAVILTAPVRGLNDSKKLSEQRRQSLANDICRDAEAWALGWACVEEIDQLNILQASLLAMRRAVAGLSVPPALLLIDGNQAIQANIQEQGVVGGDAKVAEIAAASILAKVARDRWLVQLEQRYPGYGFAQHKGYGTKLHKAALAHLGPCQEHRRSFAPIKALL